MFIMIIIMIIIIVTSDASRAANKAIKAISRGQPWATASQEWRRLHRTRAPRSRSARPARLHLERPHTAAVSGRRRPPPPPLASSSSTWRPAASGHSTIG